MRTFLLFSGAVIASIILLTQCEYPQNNQEELSIKRAELLDEVNHKLRRIDLEIEKSKHKMLSTNDDVQRRLEIFRRDLQQTKEQLEQTVHEIDSSTEDNWEVFEKAVENGLRQAEKEIEALG